MFTFCLPVYFVADRNSVANPDIPIWLGALLPSQMLISLFVVAVQNLLDNDYVVEPAAMVTEDTKEPIA